MTSFEDLVGHFGVRVHQMGMVGEMSVATAIAAKTVADAAAGDTTAFARIVAAHHDEMARLAFVICGDQSAAQDAAQSAWSIAWRKLGSVREPDRLRSWLLTVAANEARRLVRNQRRRRLVDIVIADIGSDRSDPSAGAEATDLGVALRRLSPDDRSLLSLRYVAGFDATEIGRALSMTPSGVRSRLSRLVAHLRTELRND